MVGDERTGRCAAGDGLEDRGFHFQIAVLVEIIAHRPDDLRAFLEDLLHLRVDDQVDVAHAVAELGIGEGVINCAFLLLDDRQYAERLAEHSQLRGVDRQGAGLGDEGETLDADDVADIEEFLEDGVVQGLVFAGTDFVAFDIDLDAAAVVLQFDEGRRTHDAPAHHTAGDPDIFEVAFLRIKTLLDVPGRCIDREFGCGIGLDAQFVKFLQRCAAAKFLFVEVCYFHESKKFFRFYDFNPQS